VLPISAVTVMSNVLSPTAIVCIPSPDTEALESVAAASIVTVSVLDSAVTVYSL